MVVETMIIVIQIQIYYCCHILEIISFQHIIG